MRQMISELRKASLEWHCDFARESPVTWCTQSGTRQGNQARNVYKTVASELLASELGWSLIRTQLLGPATGVLSQNH